MQIKKVFNNNVALVIDGTEEKILMGKAIGFQKYPGDFLDEMLIEKTFILHPTDPLEKLSTFFNEVSLEVIRLTSQLIQRGKEQLGPHITDSLLIPLSDHIDFALARVADGIEIEYPLKWEMKHLYPEEVAFAKEALTYIEKEASVQLPASEVVPIAMHFVNARYSGTDMKQTIEMTSLVAKVVDIINYHYFIEVNEESLHYARFITHLRYFILRQMEGETNHVNDDILYDVVKNKYPQAFTCALKISQLLEGTMRWTVNQEEVLYLTLHIHRLTTKAKD
ncbi:PRD domain-containing protein [Bacillus sp. FJAT-50079]|uniref:PRD domain-containing protein n=1 Tax=Bacillus sp. FJAT-50079 TaxID=2833577 RepID=UPI001BCA02A4|nr:PRD domain-containing protein [Bacillus sp. FJAT-50079]MBS4207112.1 PRD domain-containing protein [Bacillus sp. FJAT-50079]